jgi:excisionase family DNA binding protein
MNDSLLTPKQVSKLYPLSVSLIYQLIEERRLPHYRVGGKGCRGKLLLSPRDIEHFIQNQRVDAVS